MPWMIHAQTSVEESLLEEQEDASEQSELLEQLEALRKQPLNLNLATRDELKAIPGLSPALREEILAHREENGPFDSLTGLQSLPGMNPDTYEHLLQILTLGPQKNSHFTKPEIFWRTRVNDFVDTPVGYEDGTYHNNSRKIYNRGQFKILNKYEGGVLLEKDSGETRLDDLSLFYFSAQVTGSVRILAGNYQLQFGQGLVLWGPYGFSKSSNPVYPVRKRGRGARGYLSVDENAGMRGLAATVNASGFNITGFVSRRAIDATLVTESEISSPYISGLHRNENEMSKKDMVTEKLAGARFQYAPSAGLTMGATFYHATFDKAFNDPDFERSHFEFRGRENQVGGVDFNFEMEKAGLFGEFARSRNGGLALVSGAQMHVEMFDLAILYRNYQPEFQNFHGFGFGERNGATQNERGFYLGLATRLSRKTLLASYYDTYVFPWRTFFQPLPVSGNEFMTKVEHKINREVIFSARYRSKQREELASASRQFHQRNHQQIRLQLDYRPSGQLRLRGRIDLVRVRYAVFGPTTGARDENGALVYQDIVFRPDKRLSISGRLTFFDSESFDSRLFQYENDLPGRLTNRALFGRGTRWYLLLKYLPARSLALHFKLSETFRQDATTIGTGPDRIQGNLDRRVAGQIELRL